MKKIYQFKIELKDSNTTIWRRIQVPGDISFSDFHDIIQLSMGWEHEHLYEFVVNKIRIYDFEEVFDDGSDPLERDSMDTFLDEILTRVKTKFTYLYDFGDNWVHLIQLEKILPTVEGNTYPICLEGEGACPPEDCGGIWQYLEYLKISANKDNPEYFEVMERLGEEWDPYAFNCEAVNVLLKNYSEQWEEIYEEVGEILENLEADGFDSEDFDDVPFEEDEFLIDDEIDYYSLDSTEGDESSDIKAFSKENKPRRNDPCHCGSGKKYKKCCMDKEV